MTAISRSFFKIQLLILFIILPNCHPPIFKEARYPEEALKETLFFKPDFNDDTDLNSLALALERNLAYLEKLDPATIFQYGKDMIGASLVLEKQYLFLEFIKTNPDQHQLDEYVKENFKIYKARGGAGTGKVLFSGYFEPVFDGSLIRDDVYKYPIYMKPDNLLTIDLSLFNSKFNGQKIIARIEDKRIIPYFSRYQIETDKVLQGQNLEIAWLKDPLDVAFLHIQGSGRIKLPDEKIISVGYHEKNGRPYRSIGKYLMEKGYLTREQMSMQAIRKTLSENPQILEETLNYNPSYVFFRVLDDLPLGNLNVPVTAGRTLALDSRLFPKGALCFMICKKPVLDSDTHITGWTGFSRFVLNQDAGGAIKGSGRADLFWGKGLYAELAAGHMNHEGDLYILAPKL